MTRLIPPFLFLFLLCSLGFLFLLHPENLYLVDSRHTLPWYVPLALGIAILIWARLHFKTKQAEIHTFRHPNSLITDGPFRFSRNPMYLAFTLILCGAAFFVNTWCALVVPIAFFLVSAYWYIPYEERNLRDIFGSAFDDYALQTRRWI